MEETKQQGRVDVRLATVADLEFVGRDGFLPAEVVRRKVEAGEVVVATLAGEPVGYVRLEYLWSLVPYVAIIWVRPEDRRLGVGKALLAFVGEMLRARGHAWLYSSSQADEPQPQAWHRHVGFVECGFIAGINSGGVGEVFFRKRLGQPDGSD